LSYGLLLERNNVGYEAVANGRRLLGSHPHLALEQARMIVKTESGRVIDDLEGQARRIYNFRGEDFDPESLNFHQRTGSPTDQPRRDRFLSVLFAMAGPAA